jgi:hypothetical protein
MVELTAEQQVFIVLNYTLKVLTNSKEMHKVWFNCVLYAPVGLKKHSNKPFKFQQRLDFKRYTFFRDTLYTEKSLHYHGRHLRGGRGMPAERGTLCLRPPAQEVPP